MQIQKRRRTRNRIFSKESKGPQATLHCAGQRLANIDRQGRGGGCSPSLSSSNRLGSTQWRRWTSLTRLEANPTSFITRKQHSRMGAEDTMCLKKWKTSLPKWFWAHFTRWICRKYLVIVYLVHKSHFLDETETQPHCFRINPKLCQSSLKHNSTSIKTCYLITLEANSTSSTAVKQHSRSGALHWFYGDNVWENFPHSSFRFAL